MFITSVTIITPVTTVIAQIIELRYGIAGSAVVSNAAKYHSLSIRPVAAPGERAKRVLQAPVSRGLLFTGV